MICEMNSLGSTTMIDQQMVRQVRQPRTHLSPPKWFSGRYEGGDTALSLPITDELYANPAFEDSVKMGRPSLQCPDLKSHLPYQWGICDVADLQSSNL